MIRLLGSKHLLDLNEIALACPNDLEFFVDGVKQDCVKSADEVTDELVKHLHGEGHTVNGLCIAGGAFIEVVMRGNVEIRAKA